MPQLKSSDGVIVIDVLDSIEREMVLPQADFSLVEMPLEPNGVLDLFSSLYRTQRNNHASLVVSRLPRKLRLKAFANAIIPEAVGFKFHDTVTIVSQETFKRIPGNLTSLGEVGILFTKSDDVNKEASSWFNTEFGDCTNVWDVTPQPAEHITKTVSRHFCHEVGYLLANCASPLVCRKFLVMASLETAHVDFAKKAKMSMHGVTTDELSAKRMIRYYNKIAGSEKEADNG